MCLICVDVRIVDGKHEMLEENCKWYEINNIQITLSWNNWELKKFYMLFCYCFCYEWHDHPNASLYECIYSQYFIKLNKDCKRTIFIDEI